MNAVSIKTPPKHFTFIIQNLVSVFVVMFLFYIDEGYFDLRWMKDARNWLWFFVYLLIFSIGQMIAKVYLFKGEYNLFRSVVIGFVGIMINIILFTILFLLGRWLS